MFFNPLYLLFSLPALILGLWAQSRVRSAFAKYSKVRAASGLTGAQAARKILDANGLQSVMIERVAGNLSDHYDPRLEDIAFERSRLCNTVVGRCGCCCP